MSDAATAWDEDMVITVESASLWRCSASSCACVRVVAASNAAAPVVVVVVVVVLRSLASSLPTPYDKKKCRARILHGPAFACLGLARALSRLLFCFYFILLLFASYFSMEDNRGLADVRRKTRRTQRQREGSKPVAVVSGWPAAACISIRGF